jgi:tetratricopeptide (TPR) repeat protein
MQSRALVLAACFGLAFWTSREAAADAQDAGSDPRAPNREEARVLAEEGQRLLMAGKPAEALVKLEAADARFHAPTITVLIARALAALGRKDEAYEAYTRAIDERLAPDARKEWVEAQGVAAMERSEIAKSLGFVSLTSRGEAPARVTIDGRPVDPRGRIAVLPGAHTVTWTSTEGTTHSTPFSVAVGREAAVELAAPKSSSAAGSMPRSGSKVEAPEEPSQSLLISGITLLGLGAAGIGAGIGLGVYAMNERDALDASCRGDRCLAAVADEIEHGRAVSHGSTAAFAIGGAALAAGGILLGVHVARSSSDPSVAVVASPDGAAALGRFSW